MHIPPLPYTGLVSDHTWSLRAAVLLAALLLSAAGVGVEGVLADGGAGSDVLSRPSSESPVKISVLNSTSIHRTQRDCADISCGDL